jgi:5'-methylthioadenosine phosphorylase
MHKNADPVGVIGGTGVYDPAWLTDREEQDIETPYGTARVTGGMTNGRRVYFMNRHGTQHSVPPHRVNYRANVWALKSLGIRVVVATTAVGSLRRTIPPGTLVLADQFLDFTKSRVMTFYDGGADGVVHTDMTSPYCAGVAETLYRLGRDAGLAIVRGGTYVATEGPRFESAAEVALFGRLGGDVVGMTGVPEVVLARELGLCYATLSIVTNLGAGLSDKPLTHEEVLGLMAATVGSVRDLLMAALPDVGSAPCACLPGPRELPGGAIGRRPEGGV